MGVKFGMVYLGSFKMSINLLLTFMLWTVESKLYYYEFFIKLIDCYLIDFFNNYPILIDLSLTTSTDDFLDTIGNCDFNKSDFDFYRTLIGFINVSSKNNKISLVECQNMILEIFDIQDLDFTIEDIGLYFDGNKIITDKVSNFFYECEIKANNHILNFERWLEDIPYLEVTGKLK